MENGIKIKIFKEGKPLSPLELCEFLLPIEESIPKSSRRYFKYEHNKTDDFIIVNIETFKLLESRCCHDGHIIKFL